jgi:integrase
MRRGEALALNWEDVSFEDGRIIVRRSWSEGHLTTPKSGKGRAVAMSSNLASLLVDLLATRRRQALAQGWPDVPEWVFCSDAGMLLDERNVEPVW